MYPEYLLHVEITYICIMACLLASISSYFRWQTKYSWPPRNYKSFFLDSVLGDSVSIYNDARAWNFLEWYSWPYHSEFFCRFKWSVIRENEPIHLAHLTFTGPQWYPNWREYDPNNGLLTKLQPQIFCRPRVGSYVVKREFLVSRLTLLFLEIDWSLRSV